MTILRKIGSAGLLSTILSAGLLVANVAVAQAPSSIPENQGAAGETGLSADEADSTLDDEMMPGAGGMGSIRGRGDRGGMMPNMRGQRRGGMMVGPQGGGMTGPHGAAFFIRSGQNRIFIRCAESETMQACVDAATKLIDKVQMLKPSGQTQP
jgi:hypothetical protein